MASPIGWTDRPDRSPVRIAAKLLLGNQEIAITILNISDDGCQVECDQLLPIGAAVTVGLGNVKADAAVRWSSYEKAGLRFVK